MVFISQILSNIKCALFGEYVCETIPAFGLYHIWGPNKVNMPVKDRLLLSKNVISWAFDTDYL